MSYSTAQIWFIILTLGAGTFLLRFSFLGLIGSRAMPEWVLRMLRYTPVAVLPGMVAPLVMFPAANDGNPEPARLIAAAVTVIVGWATKSLLAAVIAGAATLFAALALI